LVLHLAEGMQLTLVMRTVRTCGLEACLEAVLGGAAVPVGPAGVLVEPVGAVPPGLAASAREDNPIEPIKQQSSAEATAASGNMDRWGALFANKKIPPRRKT
jgi:hypothetical protein